MVRKALFALAAAVCITAAVPVFTPAFASDPAPVVAVIAHPVKDFAAWKVEYDRLLPMREAAGMISARVLHAPGDPNMVILIHEFKTLEGAGLGGAAPLHQFGLPVVGGGHRLRFPI